MRIINLTQHPATPEQRAAGVEDLGPDAQAKLKELLTFESLPTPKEITKRAGDIVDLAIKASGGYDNESLDAPIDCMIGGAPYLMSALEAELEVMSMHALYAFSLRESVEERQADGSVRKVNTFRHVGFVTPPPILAQAD